MTLIDYQMKLNGLAAAEARLLTERGFIVAATRMVASINQRIIRRGQASDGGKIGAYSSKAGYYGKNAFVKKSSFKAQGQRGFKGEKVVYNQKKGTAKIVKKTPKTMFLSGGYKQLREVQGRESNFVNLEYTGSLMNDLKVGTSASSVVIGFTSEAESKKRHALEKKYGKKIFSGSKDDFQKYNDALTLETKTIVKQLLG